MYIPVEIIIDNQKELTFTLTQRAGVNFNLGNVVIGDRLPYYEGVYTVTPRVYQQVLDTENKSMSDDVTVYEIPLAQVQNPKGGLTAIIG